MDSPSQTDDEFCCGSLTSSCVDMEFYVINRR